MKTIKEIREYWRKKAIKQREGFFKKHGCHPEVFRRFGRNPKTIFKRDGWACQICGSDNDLTIDHIDGNGRNSKKPNNDINNLRTLCRVCHGREDRKRARKWEDRTLEARMNSLANLKLNHIKSTQG